MSDRCDHSNFVDTSLHGDGGIPTRRCLSCEAYFDDSDLGEIAGLDAAEMAGAKDDKWSKRFQRELLGLGYVALPWPAHLDPPHAAVVAHPDLDRPDVSVELYIVDGDVMRAMARALEYAGVIPPIGKQVTGP